MVKTIQVDTVSVLKQTQPTIKNIYTCTYINKEINGVVVVVKLMAPSVVLCMTGCSRRHALNSQEYTTLAIEVSKSPLGFECFI